jgi:hypothetical protein
MAKGVCVCGGVDACILNICSSSSFILCLSDGKMKSGFSSTRVYYCSHGHFQDGPTSGSSKLGENNNANGTCRQTPPGAKSMFMNLEAKSFSVY